MSVDHEAAFLARVAALEDLGWAEVAARMDRWAGAGYAGDWLDDEYDLPADLDITEGE